METTRTKTLKKTLCNRDCPDSCGIVAEVEEGRVVSLRGDREHPVTQGFLCYRTSHFLRRQYDARRLTRPLLRRGGQLVEVSFGEALDHVARSLRRILDEDGPAAILHYRSGGTLGHVTAEASELFFDRLGPVTVKRGDICSGAGEAAQLLDFGDCDSSRVEDLLAARHILLWGKNVFTSSPHLLPLLKRAAAQGTKILLVDPVHHATTRLADRFVQPRPAGDFALAMAVASLLFARGGVHPQAADWCDGLDDFQRLVEMRSRRDWLADADVSEEEALALADALADGPTTILVGWGMARRLAGGHIVRALDALGAITGNVGIPGGQVSYYFARRRGIRPFERRPPARTIPEPLLGPAILDAADPPIRAVWVTAGNPVAMLPDSATTRHALESRELVVVVDDWRSDTADAADVVFPTTTLLEDHDLLGAYGHHYLGVARPVVEPPEGVKSDRAIFLALGEALGLALPELEGEARDVEARLLAGPLAEAGVELADLERGVVQNPLAPPVIFEGRRFCTPNGRAQLVTTAPPAAPPDPDRPLWLMSLSTPDSQSSQWAKAPPSPATVTVHPDVAPDLDGELACLSSVLGQLTVRVRHDPKQRRDVALIPKGGHLRDGAAANALTRARLTDLGEGGALYDERVRLDPLTG
ncbi:MAG: molybdopterin-dependent oxidoreductase [Myxococcales bacterium]|nr:molybdopterin-dependent oxidoreductase [Myxococcales bacterium]